MKRASPAIEWIAKRWKRPVKDRVSALKHFSVVFEGTVPEQVMSHLHKSLESLPPGR